MVRKHRPEPDVQPEPAPAAEPAAAATPAPDDLARLESEDLARAEATRHDGPLVEPAAEAVRRLEAEAAEWKDRALRATADHDNYRKRAVREREEALARGQADVLGRVVEVVDDLSRVAHLDAASTTPQALQDGMLAIERKFVKLLETLGVERIDPAGQPFDPTAHEAVTVMPAGEAAQDQAVAAVFQPGYRLRGTLLRPAKVAVYQWNGGAGAAASDAP